MKAFILFLKKETVLCVALVLAVISAFPVPPDKQYIGYIDWRTLAVLFGLMTVMAGLQAIGVFRLIAEKLLGMVKSSRQLLFILVMLCFFFSMVITNDVALITFVPFTFTVLALLDKDTAERLVIPVVVMQTIAANLGSMLTPIGNPQNLYLYGRAGLSPLSFVGLMFPYTLVSFGMLTVWCLWLGRKKSPDRGRNRTERYIRVEFQEYTSLRGKEKLLILYLLLFVLCLLTVARILPYGITLVVVLAAVLAADRKVLGKVDYSLLLTFAGFFVFIGNMGRIPVFSDFLGKMIDGNEVLTSVAASQLISNVPAALLLSGFTERYEALIVGTNLGGLGTLIASMASLISYKYMARERKEQKGRYLIYFTVANVVFLLILLVLSAVLGRQGSIKIF